MAQLDSEKRLEENSNLHPEERHTLAGWFLKKLKEKGGSLFIPRLRIRILANGDVIEVNEDGSPKEPVPHV